MPNFQSLGLNQSDWWVLWGWEYPREEVIVC